MVTIRQLRAWLNRLDGDDMIGVSEDGHAITTPEGVEYFELGRMPLDYHPGGEVDGWRISDAERAEMDLLRESGFTDAERAAGLGRVDPEAE